MLPSITANSKTFNPAKTGQYLLSTLTWGQPLSYFKLSPGSSAKNGVTTMSVARVVQKDVTINGKIERQQLSVQAIVQTTGAFTTAEIDDAFSDIAAYITPASLDYQLNGGQ